MIGLLVGLCSFISIGVFHPIVVKAEYHLGRRSWPLFLLGSIFSGWRSIKSKHYFSSTIWGVVAFSFLWSIHELNEQEERVRKGWFPANPKRKNQ